MREQYTVSLAFAMTFMGEWSSSGKYDKTSLLMDKVTPTDVLEARRRLTGHVWLTPCVHASWLSARVGCDVFLKLENLQHTGSF
ncbi:MAG: hypothetical protein RMM98_18250, partial [Acidobacteriota bacterium]|nr:hypothetical protein [Acidobacteriota bacterium]